VTASINFHDRFPGIPQQGWMIAIARPA
jgi:hypothetical protein